MFNAAAFIQDINEAKQACKFTEILSCEDLEITGKLFTVQETELLKIIHNHSNYIPYVPHINQRYGGQRDTFKEIAAVIFFPLTILQS